MILFSTLFVAVLHFSRSKYDDINNRIQYRYTPEYHTSCTSVTTKHDNFFPVQNTTHRYELTPGSLTRGDPVMYAIIVYGVYSKVIRSICYIMYNI